MSDLVGNPQDRFSHNKAHFQDDKFSQTAELEYARTMSSLSIWTFLQLFILENFSYTQKYITGKNKLIYSILLIHLQEFGTLTDLLGYKDRLETLDRARMDTLQSKDDEG